MPRRFGLTARLLAAGGCLLAATPVRAQDSGDGFLFRAPRGTVAVRGGFDRASADSQLFRFVTNELTLTRRDFSSASVVLDVAYSLGARTELVFSAGTARSTTPSEFRGWLDNNNQPIQQTTVFQRVPLTASVKQYLAPPGQSVGHYAWIPKRYAPYVGAGGGAMWYRFGQGGDFIDFDTLNVFGDEFTSDGWTATVHAFAGVEVSLTPRLAVTTEGRYQWAHAPLGADFSGFDRIDLSGFSVTTGILVRY